MRTELRTGQYVEFIRSAPFPKGRYRLRHESLAAWTLEPIGYADGPATSSDELQALLDDGCMRLIDGRTIERERALVAARLAAPIRAQDRTSAPVDGLALFDAIRSPALL